MANPNYDQKRREAANEGRLHEHREDAEMDWTDRDERSDRSGSRHAGESDQHHHHHHHHHHGDQSGKSGRDYERLAEEAHSRARGTQRRETRHGRTERRYGQRREQQGRESREQGSPHEGSQRGSHREEGISGRMTGQRGEATHHTDPSDSTFREGTGGEREHRHGGERGTSERDRRYGSRRGHGSERRTERRHSSN